MRLWRQKFYGDSISRWRSMFIKKIVASSFDCIKAPSFLQPSWETTQIVTRNEANILLYKLVGITQQQRTFPTIIWRQQNLSFPKWRPCSTKLSLSKWKCYFYLHEPTGKVQIIFTRCHRIPRFLIQFFWGKSDWEIQLIPTKILGSWLKSDIHFPVKAKILFLKVLGGFSPKV